MKVWVCEKCGCQVKENKPNSCPICGAPGKDFYESEAPDPDKEDEEFTKKFEEVVDKLDEYTEDCEPEDERYAFEE